MTAPKSIVVTGCAGFIGSQFALAFKQHFPKTEVIGIDDMSEGREDAIPDSTIFYKGSILDTALLERIFKKHRPQYVFHFAARPRVSFSVEHPFETSEVNIGGTIRLLQASAKHGAKRLIFSSSSSVYGIAKKLPVAESDMPNPQSPYALQKLTSELFCKQWSELFGLDTASLRYFNAYGPGQYGDSAYITVVAAWLEALYFPKNKQGFIEGAGMQSRDFSYIDDIIEANVLAMQSRKPLRGGVFNIASGKAYSLKDIRKRIERYAETKLKLEQRPPRKGDVQHTLADISKARRVLGYQPQTDFETGLAATIEWFKARAL